MSDKKKHILVIPNWYPTPNDAFSGIFVQKHLKCIAIENKVSVIFAKPENIKKVKFQNSEFQNLSERIIIFKKQYTKINFIDLLIRAYYYYYYLIIETINIIKENPIDLIHVHVVGKNAFLAFSLSLIFKKKIFITEHSSFFLSERNIKIGFSKRVFLKIIFSVAKKVSVVSKVLGENLIKSGFIKNYTIIPNVVDNQIFVYKNKIDLINKSFGILHISDLKEDTKNISSLIKAVNILNKKDISFNLTIIGDGNDEIWYKNMVSDLELKEKVFFKKSMSPYELVNQMHKADILTLCSNVETFGCVVAEALVCGLPAVVSNRGALPELIDDSNGFLVQNPKNAEEIADAIIFAMKSIENLDKKSFSEIAIQKFNPLKISKLFNDWYNS